MKSDILIIDDEKDIRGLIEGILEDEGYTTRQAANDRQAYDLFAQKVPDLVILDIWLNNSQDDGLKILENIKKDHPHVPVVMISGHGNIETAVTAIKNGAYDFIEKPFKTDRLLLMMQRALENAALRIENETLKSRVMEGEGTSNNVLGNSHVINNLRSTLEKVAQTNSRVLLTGEPGTGKDVAARFIHRNSGRKEMSFHVLNCATMRPEHLETELFGKEDSAGNIHRGIFENSDGGTLFLDEVADMPLETQGKIVRVLQDQHFTRVGGQVPVQVDVRVIASTNRNLERLMEKGDFRKDLFYRLNVVPINLPSLRERVEDIPILAIYFAEQYARQSGMPVCTFTDKAIRMMQSHDWPGNVRQLKNVVEWCLIMNTEAEGAIDSDSLPPEINPNAGRNTEKSSNGKKLKNDNAVADFGAMSLRDARESFEKHYIQSQIRRFGGNVSKTAEFVGMERSALHRKIKQLGIDLNESANSNDEVEKDNHLSSNDKNDLQKHKEA